MKGYNTLFLTAAFCASTAYATIELGQYFSGNYVDKDNRTFLHMVALHSCKNKCEVTIDLFDFMRNKLPVEIPKLNNSAECLYFVSRVDPNCAYMIVAETAIRFANRKDNNGDTALDLARKAHQDAVADGETPPEDNQILIALLEKIEQKSPHD
jgi:ankyrin repeat protein